MPVAALVASVPELPVVFDVPVLLPELDAPPTPPPLLSTTTLRHPRSARTPNSVATLDVCLTHTLSNPT
jgi:hypothetical protein